MNRRSFLLRSSSALACFYSAVRVGSAADSVASQARPSPMVLSTWPHGVKANEAAWEVLSQGGRSLDAVEKGVMDSELDPEVNSVGYGSYPDSEGNVTLDACIMDETGNAGSVAYLQHIKTPIAVARKVMEKTPHVMLSGQGALDFALENGFRKEKLLTDASKKKWEEWKRKKINKPVDHHNHDTISMLAIDKNGNISGACTTGGLAFKLPGRVGDSPIVGAGLYVDNEVGGAGGTGVGEVIMKIVGSHLIVELMRQGATPQEACEEAVRRAMKKVPDANNLPVYFIALNKRGEYGAFGTRKGFEYVLCTEEKGNQMFKADGIL